MDNNYFNKIDTEYKAYILGFIYADGCLIDNINGRQKRLSIEIQEKDGYILNKLALDIVGRLPYLKIKKRENESNTYMLNISSDEIVTDLINLGCNIRKSQVGMVFPKIDDEFVNHFIRGFFDGDGCITVNEVKNRYKRTSTRNIPNSFAPKLRKRVHFSSTDLDFLEKVISYLPFKCKAQIKSSTKVQTCYTISLEGQLDVLDIHDYLYKYSTCYLTRKRDKFNMTISSQASATVEEGSETT